MAFEGADTSVLVSEYVAALFDLGLERGDFLVCSDVVFEELEIHVRNTLCFDAEEDRLGGWATECERSLGIRTVVSAEQHRFKRVKRTSTLSLNGIKPVPWIFLRNVGSK